MGNGPCVTSINPMLGNRVDTLKNVDAVKLIKERVEKEEISDYLFFM
jgi:hypothetical protein